MTQEKKAPPIPCCVYCIKESIKFFNFSEQILEEKYMEYNYERKVNHSAYLSSIGPEINDKEFEDLCDELENLSKRKNISNKPQFMNREEVAIKFKIIFESKTDIINNRIVQKKNLKSIIEKYHIKYITDSNLRSEVRKEVDNRVNYHSNTQQSGSKQNIIHIKRTHKFFNDLMQEENPNAILDLSISEHDIYNPYSDSSRSSARSLKRFIPMKNIFPMKVKDCKNITTPEGQKDIRKKIRKKKDKACLLKTYSNLTISKFHKYTGKANSRNVTKQSVVRSNMKPKSIIVNNSLFTLKKKVKLRENYSTASKPYENANEFLYKNLWSIKTTKEVNSRHAKKHSREVRKERSTSLVHYWVMKDKNRSIISAQTFLNSSLERRKKNSMEINEREYLRNQFTKKIIDTKFSCKEFKPAKNFIANLHKSLHGY